MIYHESDYEEAFISMLEENGWQRMSGRSIPRKSQTDVLYADDLEEFLTRTGNDLTPDDISRITHMITNIGAESHFAVLHRVHTLLTDGMKFTSQNGKTKTASLIDFEHCGNNIFRAVNQFTVEYNYNGQTENRRPDILLFVNGIPLCIIELKNPIGEKAGIFDAWQQIYYRYWRDIPRLLHYCMLACISDGVKTRLGTVRTPYEHFYAWRRVNDGDKLSSTAFDETDNMIKGALSPERFIEIIRDYVYFQDSSYDNGEHMIVCRYPQFFAARLLKKSIIKSVTEHSGKGGTYFGATGCGKTYTMLFLARQLSMRCRGIGSPTIVMIVDRDELQEQGAELFTKSSEFLGIGEVMKVASRNHLRDELSKRESGGFYICTIQKFCDRDNDPIGEINTRGNIICFSDEAHRTQIEHSRAVRFSKEAEQNKRAVISKPYASVLREAFPNATFVGFTGTPIAETYQTFGAEIDRYTMDMAAADGLTVPIKYHPRIARVFLDAEKAEEIEEYYRQCADDGAAQEDIEKSKKAMSSMETILGEHSRLERLADDIHEHYTASLSNDPERIQKAMIVCSSRKNAFNLLRIFKKKYPEWFVEHKQRYDIKVTDDELRDLKPVPFMAMAASVKKNDDPEMYNYLGGVQNDKRCDELAAAFKQEKSNFSIAIVVDMWITGFDVPSLTYMYNDKPLKKHMLIQTISRVNRKFPGKAYGLVVDYIGIRDNMREAMKLYGGDVSVAHSEDDVKEAAKLFRQELIVLKNLFNGYDLSPILDSNCGPVERYKRLTEAQEYVLSSTEKFKINSDDGKKINTVIFRTYFLRTVTRLRGAYDICQPSGELAEDEASLAQCFMAVAALVRRHSGTSDLDTETMNIRVAKMVEEALKYNKVESVLESGDEEDIFSPEYTEMLSEIKLPASKLELLIKMLRKQITEYGKTNKIAAKKFKDMLEQTIKQYHERRENLSTEEAGIAQEETSERIIKNATEQALKILEEMRIDRESFRKVGLTFEEKAFYDILMTLRVRYHFEYGEDKNFSEGVTVNEMCKSLAQKIKGIIDMKSKYSDWLNNQIVRDNLKFDIKVCLIKNGYPPQYSPEVFRKVMEQIENFKKNN